MTAAGVFYPAGADSAEERLAYYASSFPVVEVDATYYALPAERTAQLWAERTPPDFTFDIKAHALMTGQGTETKRLPKSIREALPEELAGEDAGSTLKDFPDELNDEVWRTFREALAPLEETGQLGSILLQYPKWVFPSNENRALIEDAVERLQGWQVAVEFRNGSWLNEKNRDRTLGFLAERAIPFVMVDEPQGFKSSVPARSRVTSPDLAIVRFHGRNAETWEKKGITPAERFRYLYSSRRALGVGPASPRGRLAGEGDARALQQLLRELRDDERPRDRRAPPRPGGRRGVAPGGSEPSEAGARPVQVGDP